MRLKFPSEYIDIARLGPVGYTSPRFQNEHYRYTTRQERTTGPTIMMLEFSAICDITPIDEVLRRNIGQQCQFTHNGKRHLGVLQRYSYINTISGYNISIEFVSVYNFEELELYDGV